MTLVGSAAYFAQNAQSHQTVADISIDGTITITASSATSISGSFDAIFQSQLGGGNLGTQMDHVTGTIFGSRVRLIPGRHGHAGCLRAEAGCKGFDDRTVAPRATFRAPQGRIFTTKRLSLKAAPVAPFGGARQPARTTFPDGSTATPAHHGLVLRPAEAALRAEVPVRVDLLEPEVVASRAHEGRLRTVLDRPAELERGRGVS